MTKAHLGWWSGERFWQCTEHVFSGERSDMRGHLCGHAAKEDPDADGNPTKCKLHSASGTAKRKAKIDAKYAAYCAKRDQEYARRNLSREALAIVQQIAAGHNDPRALCLDWVARWEQNESPPPQEQTHD